MATANLRRKSSVTVILVIKTKKLVTDPGAAQPSIRLSLSFGLGFSPNHSWKRKIAFKTCAGAARLFATLQIVVIDCRRLRGEKEIPRRFPFSTYRPGGLGWGVSFNTAARRRRKRSGERVACVCMRGVVKPRYLRNTSTCTVWQRPRTRQHPALEQQQLDWHAGVPHATRGAGIDGVPGDRPD